MVYSELHNLFVTMVELDLSWKIYSSPTITSTVQDLRSLKDFPHTSYTHTLARTRTTHTGTGIQGQIPVVCMHSMYKKLNGGEISGVIVIKEMEMKVEDVKSFTLLWLSS